MRLQIGKFYIQIGRAKPFNPWHSKDVPSWMLPPLDHKYFGFTDDQWERLKKENERAGFTVKAPYEPR